MTEVVSGVETHNGGAVATPHEVAPEAFQRRILAAADAGARVVAYYGEGHAPHVTLTAVLADDRSGRLEILRSRVDGPSLPSLTPQLTELHLFEREVFERNGLEPLGHPWLKPVRFTRDGDVVGVTDYYRVEGEGVHEVGVGPIHAGIIEPGHFRFQCHGETVFHLEISLGYQHRGVEGGILRGPTKRVLHLVETAAGDTTIAHTLAHCEAREALAGTRVPARAQAIRAVALELERLANHVGDLGALAGDVAFLPTASYCGRIRGELLNLTAALCGNRFGRGLVVPGGVAFDVADPAELVERLAVIERDATGAVDLLWSTPAVRSRFEETGGVATATAQELGLVGVAARASGVAVDVRSDHPTGMYRLAHIPMSVATSGDVYARASVRWLECARSFAFVREQLTALPRGPVRVPLGPLEPASLVVALSEGWRGEVAHVVRTDAAGGLASYRILDPSFHNWSGLAMALRSEAISDFPLCNKSFNLSYCGYDL
ncbi:MAG: hydrogenase [Deltaproteobacteria bacterium HGW-Deltaproteobacteria-14]|nr:MAG: hydrogenase [Deltaproteobacteria bacterium HGW-Deltaproteobacteria-14]